MRKEEQPETFDLRLSQDLKPEDCGLAVWSSKWAVLQRVYGHSDPPIGSTQMFHDSAELRLAVCKLATTIMVK